MRLAVVWVCGVLLASLAWFASGQVVEGPREVIEVEGYAFALLEPDYAEWTVQIVTRDKAPQIALELNDALMQSLLKIAKSADVDEKDITKGRPAVEQVFRESQDDRAFGPYEATKVQRQITFAMHDLDAFEDALLDIHKLGVVYRVRYKSSAYEKTVARVKREALLDAKQQARDQAKAIGQAVGPAVRVDVVQGYLGGGGGLFGDNDWRDDSDPGAAGPDGKVRVEAYADAEFKLEP
ncbi:MAG: SIMPL domain-containing protein [Phycisphaeraceae bacterium]